MLITLPTFQAERSLLKALASLNTAPPEKTSSTIKMGGKKRGKKINISAHQKRKEENRSIQTKRPQS